MTSPGPASPLPPRRLSASEELELTWTLVYAPGVVSGLRSPSLEPRAGTCSRHAYEVTAMRLDAVERAWPVWQALVCCSAATVTVLRARYASETYLSLDERTTLERLRFGALGPVLLVTRALDAWAERYLPTEEDQMRGPLPALTKLAERARSRLPGAPERLAEVEAQARARLEAAVAEYGPAIQRTSDEASLAEKAKKAARLQALFDKMKLIRPLAVLGNCHAAPARAPPLPPAQPA